MVTGPIPHRAVQKTYPVRILLFFLGVVLFISLANIAYQAVQTFGRLDVVERERDQWQRPEEVIQMLNLKQGDVVADLGSGAGYFSLKLASAVGKQGKVLAVDIRRLPLSFLWVRALLRNHRNVHIIHSDPENPYLTTGSLDAVLVANTYHELTNPKTITDALFRALRNGGRLVIVDRAPTATGEEARDSAMQHHEIPAALVENEIRQSGFEIVSRQDHFIQAAGDVEQWWLLVASKSQ